MDHMILHKIYSSHVLILDVLSHGHAPPVEDLGYRPLMNIAEAWILIGIP